jgi:uncharacterized protein YggU (UPF0235/DUF167 family)
MSPVSVVPNLSSYQWIVANSSAGKESQAMLDFVVEQCDRAGVPRSRVSVLRGETARDKVVRVEGVGRDELRAALAVNRLELAPGDDPLL